MSESICNDCMNLVFSVTSSGNDYSQAKCDLFQDADVRRIGVCAEFMDSKAQAVTRKAERPESSNGATSTAIEGNLPTTRPTRESCLSAARDAVVGGREVAYGSPEDNFARIARLWAAFLHNKTGQEIAVNETDVALMLDLVKTARLQHNPGHVDSWVDKAGYSACGCEIGGRA